MKQLKVGDRLYRESYGVITNILKIDRLTKTQAIGQSNGGERKFKIDLYERNQSEYIANLIGGVSRWENQTYYLESESLKIKLYKQKVVSHLKQTDFSKLTDTQLTQIYNIVVGV